MKRLKRPHSVVGMIESHQRQVNVPEFIAIAEALDADATELFGRYFASGILVEGFADF